MKLQAVYSTLAAPMDYAVHKAGPNEMPIEVARVHIKGGAGVANSNLQTPRGVATFVTAEQIELLRQCPVFVLHEKNGFVVIDDEGQDPEAVAAMMEGRDNSAQLVPQDYEANGQDAPIVGAPKDDDKPATVAVSGPGTAGKGKGGRK